MSKKTVYLLSLTEIAATLGLSERSIQRLVASKSIPCKRVGNTPVFIWSDVARAIGLPEELRETNPRDLHLLKAQQLGDAPFSILSREQNAIRISVGRNVRFLLMSNKSGLSST